MEKTEEVTTRITKQDWRNGEEKQKRWVGGNYYNDENEGKNTEKNCMEKGVEFKNKNNMI